jgi:SanA protein
MRLWWIAGSVLGGLVLLAALAWLANARLDRTSDRYLSADPEQLPPMDVALVLGAAPIGPEGGPNRYFEYRLDAAAALWRAGKVKYLLVSGDGDEPTAMRAGLVKRGMPAEAIYRDVAGVRTHDSVERAKSVFGQMRLIIVTQRFHAVRAIFLARHDGIEAWGLEARDVARPYNILTTLRRYPSALRAYWDVWLDTPARHAGRPIVIGVDPASAAMSRNSGTGDTTGLPEKCASRLRRTSAVMRCWACSVPPPKCGVITRLSNGSSSSWA